MQFGAGERGQPDDEPPKGMTCLCAEGKSRCKEGGQDRGEER